MTGFFNPEFWASLTGPGLATIAAVLFVWAVATERLVPGGRYRAERARGDKYEESFHDATKALIENTAGTVAATEMVASFRKEIAALAAARDVT
ncbi:hypothetical protein [Mycolicibacterium fluoranthenivorans]|uniref:Uncharacterized protein n=1 Tax=Mycolicibacterium fluoranthenivorans TaxID=258505 RepID=A0A1G4VHH5_9MYCO|nr:hypothetical protein [Mycolicibacterium fluoranthenivorans]SCX06064.1 hypothetical protein SAMN02799620_00806 [Mycolicibacterium fluoranthenivorans]